MTYSRKFTTKEYVKRLKNKGSSLRPTEEYQGALQKISHVCKLCGCQVNVRPNHVLNNDVRCLFCGEGRPTRGSSCLNKEGKDKKTYLLGDRLVYIMGYENFGLDFLLAQGLKPKDIIVSTEGGVPKIRYNEVRAHFPDFYIPKLNRIVEVKGPPGLGLQTGALYEEAHANFRNTRDKCLAAKEAGYSYVVLLFNNKGERILLPRNWFYLSYDELLEHFNAKVVLEKRVRLRVL